MDKNDIEIKNEVYDSLSEENKKKYLEIIHLEFEDYSILDEFSNNLLNQVIATCDSEIEWYSKVGYKNENTLEKQELFIEAIKLKRQVLHYLKEKQKVNPKR